MSLPQDTRITMTGLHPLTLNFRDPETEKSYERQALPRILVQGRIAIAIGTFVYLLYGLLDLRFLAPDQLSRIWNLRLLGIWIPAVVLLFSFHPLFKRFHQYLLALVGLTTGIVLTIIIWSLPTELSAYYFPGQVLIVLFNVSLLGTRFLAALGVNLFLFAVYNIVFVNGQSYPSTVLLSNDVYFMAAILIGGAGGYLAEYQARQLFTQQLELDASRRLHIQRALHDRLTGLPNRELLTDRINRTLAKARRDGSLNAGIFVDLDGFKTINDQFGHDNGDVALRRIARRLQTVVREADTVARIGGDEFFILTPEIGTRGNASRLCEKLIALIKKPISGLPANARLSASVGVCLFPDNEEEEGEEADAIIRRADKAMYRAKASGAGRFVFADHAKA